VSPDRLVNNGLARALVRRAGFARARALFAAALGPVAMPPWRMARLRRSLDGWLRRYLPELGERRVREVVRAFPAHWRSKLAEDCVVMNTDGVPAFVDAIARHVAFEGKEHFHRALEPGTGVLAVGAHVGGVTFGTPALLSLFLDVPRERYRLARLCAEPEVERYPRVIANLEQALRDYGGDVRFVLTRRASKPVATELAAALDAGGFVTTNLDVMMGGSSERAFELFRGARLRLPALVGAAKVALRTGAAILPWVNVRTEGGFLLALEPPIGPVPRLGETVPDGHPELDALCERLRATLERWIVDRPEQWTYWDRFGRRLLG
jgi:lauroyl/myristoyl acyltransferase